MIVTRGYTNATIVTRGYGAIADAWHKVVNFTLNLVNFTKITM